MIIFSATRIAAVLPTATFLFLPSAAVHGHPSREHSFRHAPSVHQTLCRRLIWFCPDSRAIKTDIIASDPPHLPSFRDFRLRQGKVKVAKIDVSFSLPPFFFPPPPCFGPDFCAFPPLTIGQGWSSVSGRRRSCGGQVSAHFDLDL